MINSYQEYKDKALRSIKPHDSKDLAIADWVIGLAGETGEVLELLVYDTEEEMDRMKVAKEIGDVLWYGTALEEELQLDLNVTTDVEIDLYNGYNLTKLVIEVSKISEAVKHFIFHKESDKRTVIRHHLLEGFRLLVELCAQLEIDVKDCAALNAEKLAHRYNLKNGGEYSKEASAARHTAEEKFEDTEIYRELYDRINAARIQ